MYNLLHSRREGSVLRFTFATTNGDDHEWHHSTVADPILDWLHQELQPLARKLREQLTPQKLVKCISFLAARELISTANVDWLGLALLALRLYGEAVDDLAAEDSTEHEQNCFEAAILAKRLCDLSEQFTWAIDDKLRQLPAD